MLKSQTVRALDVFFIGPVMIVGGSKLWKQSTLLGATLGVLGALTIWYNARNYLRHEAQEQVGEIVTGG